MSEDIIKWDDEKFPDVIKGYCERYVELTQDDIIYDRGNDCLKVISDRYGVKTVKVFFVTGTEDVIVIKEWMDKEVNMCMYDESFIQLANDMEKQYGLKVNVIKGEVKRNNIFGVRRYSVWSVEITKHFLTRGFSNIRDARNYLLNYAVERYGVSVNKRVDGLTFDEGIKQLEEASKEMKAIERPKFYTGEKKEHVADSNKGKVKAVVIRNIEDLINYLEKNGDVIRVDCTDERGVTIVSRKDGGMYKTDENEYTLYCVFHSEDEAEIIEYAIALHEQESKGE